MSPLRTTSAGTIASVNGMRNRKVVPAPGLDSTSTLPPTFSTWDRTTSSPTPRPETLVICVAVENPGRKISCNTSRASIDATRSGVSRPRSTAFAVTRSAEIPAPSSITSTTTDPF